MCISSEKSQHNLNKYYPFTQRHRYMYNFYLINPDRGKKSGNELRIMLLLYCCSCVCGMCDVCVFVISLQITNVLRKKARVTMCHVWCAIGNELVGLVLLLCSAGATKIDMSNNLFKTIMKNDYICQVFFTAVFFLSVFN